MTHTTNYNLNKFEAADRVTRDGFNQNADLIDAAIKAASDAAGAAQSTANSASSAAAAAQSAANAAAAAAAGGVRVETGTYIGTGTYGQSSPPCSFTFSAQPYLVIISGYGQLLLQYGADKAFMNSGGGTAGLNYVDWNGSTVTWYSNINEFVQMNSNTWQYTYLALLPAA